MGGTLEASPSYYATHSDVFSFPLLIVIRLYMLNLLNWMIIQYNGKYSFIHSLEFSLLKSFVIGLILFVLVWKDSSLQLEGVDLYLIKSMTKSVHVSFSNCFFLILLHGFLSINNIKMLCAEWSLSLSYSSY